MKRPTAASLKKVTSANLEALGAGRLAALLLSAAEGRPDLKRKLRMELAAAQGAEHLSAEIDKRLGSLETSRSKLSWRARPPFIRDVEALRCLIAGQLAELDPDGALARLWVFMGLARRLEMRVRDKDGSLAAVFERAAGDIATLLAVLDSALHADALVDALAENPHAWRTWLPRVLQGARAEFAAAALKEISERSDASRSWLPLARQLADRSGDVDAYLATFDPEALLTPSAAAGAAVRLLAADRVQEAGDILRKAAPPKGETATRGRTAEPDAEWEGVWIDYLERTGEVDVAQAVRWSAFERTLSVDRARAFIKRLSDFEDVEAEQRALTFAMEHPDFARGLGFLMDWPAVPEAARVIRARAKEAEAVAPDRLELWAGRLRVRQPAAAAILLRKAAAAAFRRREFATSTRLTQEADAVEVA